MNIKVFRTQTQQMPMTAVPFSANKIVRATTTATKKIQPSANAPVISITGYTTVKGSAAQGTTPAVGKLATQHSASGSARPSVGGLFRGVR